MRNRLEIKSEAKSILRSAHASPLLVTAIVLVVCYVLERIMSLIEYGTLFPDLYLLRFYLENFEYLMSSDPYLFMTDPDAALYYAGFAWPTISGTLTTTFFSILISLFTTVLYGGYYIYCMGIRQGLRMPCTTLFDGLSVAGKLIWCSILVGIKTFLWSLLFVIPGIVAAYRYRFALYNVLTDDSLSAGEAIHLSCQQTRGAEGHPLRTGPELHRLEPAGLPDHGHPEHLGDALPRAVRPGLLRGRPATPGPQPLRRFKQRQRTPAPRMGAVSTTRNKELAAPPNGGAASSLLF